MVVVSKTNCFALLPGEGELLRIFDEEFVVQVTSEGSKSTDYCVTNSSKAQ